MPQHFGRTTQELVVEPTGSHNSSPKKASNGSGWSHASQGMQLAVTLLLFIFLGYKLDARKGTSPLFTIAGSVLGIVVGLYGFLRPFLRKDTPEK